ncbi:hypothetical protein N7516_000627 [Penicillium verrucosum]|uniref:uncharacterized protein n=1 Tax=Penicillium verrucosum TaxID=60171 RepID=UPI0025455933|nr:uncharacterized protein N7516_000627 [Penicillium verrucosum]KAJ5940459.1 hypothetical protein N7516_000627 [Penicillium verrucosum]
MSINLMRPAQCLICAKALAVGPEESDKECVCQADFENDWFGASKISVTLAYKTPKSDGTRIYLPEIEV